MDKVRIPLWREADAPGGDQTNGGVITLPSQPALIRCNRSLIRCELIGFIRRASSCSRSITVHTTRGNEILSVHTSFGRDISQAQRGTTKS